MKHLLSFKNIMNLLVACAVLLAALGYTSNVSAQSTCGATYIVQQGDTLSKIARKCGVSYSDLLKANPTIKNPSLIYAGQVINIATRIQFAAGGTAASLQGQLSANGSITYLVNAASGQTLEVTVTAPSDVTLAVSGADGSTLKSASTTLSFRGILPKNQDYLLVLKAPNRTVDYGLSLDIPVRIQFAAGGTSATLTGTVPATVSQYFILKASKGQTLNVTATPADKLQLSVYGVDGTVLKSGMGEGASFSGALPGTQDYILVLKSANQVQSFTLNVSIPAPIPVTGTNSYTVQAGDTLYSIAKRFNTTVKVLQRANPEITDPNVLKVGQVIYLPGATITLPGGQKVYVAKSGDSMSAIARLFSTTLDALIRANPQISNPNIIYTGQRINLP